MNEKKKSYKRLTRADRDVIEHLLNRGISLSEIAKEMGFALSTITREVKEHRTDVGYRRRTATGNLSNVCAFYKTCEKINVCTICQRRRPSRCASCKQVRCSNMCKDFIRQYCSKTQRSPYVCNSCAKATGCSFHKWRYVALDAQRMADAQRVDSRAGIDADPEVIKAINEIIRPLLEQGQSPSQIWLTHADEIPFSRRSFYRYNALGLFGMTAFDLHKKVRYKQRRKNPMQSPLKVPDGHTYKDFSSLDEEIRQSVVEMDTVMGCKEDVGSILTLHLRHLHFQIGIKLAYHDCKHAKGALDFLEQILGSRFVDIFGVGLCDRGIEFFDTTALEASVVFKETKRMHLYYCDARHSEQKGAAEKNHVEFRKIVPKGTSIDRITNYELAKIFSHINSTPRRSLFGVSPMQLAMEVLPKEFFDELGLSLIPPDKVILNPSLLK